MKYRIGLIGMTGHTRYTLSARLAALLDDCKGNTADHKVMVQL